MKNSRVPKPPVGDIWKEKENLEKNTTSTSVHACPVEGVPVNRRNRWGRFTVL